VGWEKGVKKETGEYGATRTGTNPFLD